MSVTVNDGCQGRVIGILVNKMECGGKYESFTLLGATKDDCKIFLAYVSQSVGSVLCIVSTKLSNFALKTSVSRNDLSSRPNLI